MLLQKCTGTGMAAGWESLSWFKGKRKQQQAVLELCLSSIELIRRLKLKKRKVNVVLLQASMQSYSVPCLTACKRYQTWQKKKQKKGLQWKKSLA